MILKLIVLIMTFSGKFTAKWLDHIPYPVSPNLLWYSFIDRWDKVRYEDEDSNAWHF